MYNMEISLFGFKLNVEMLILIGIIYLILVVHTIGGCCNMPRIMESLQNMNSSDSSSSSNSNSSNNMKKAAFLKNNQQ
jgi:hypothetical protein